MSNFAETALDVLISRIPQANYLTPLIPFGNYAVKPYVYERVKQRAFPRVAATKKNNKDYSGGNGFATDSWVEDWSSSYSFALDFASQNIGRYLLMAFGSVTTTELVAGQVYKHVFKPLDKRTTSVMPSYALGIRNAAAAGGVNSMFPSMCCDDFKLASSGKARLDGSMSLTGSGDEIEPFAIDPLAHALNQEGALNYFYHQQSNLSIADHKNQATVENLSTCHLLGWNFGVQNQYAAGDYGCPRFVLPNDPESGSLRSHYLLLSQMFMLDYLLKMRADDPARAALKSQQALAIEAKLTGRTITGVHKHSLALKSYLSKYDSVDRGFTDGFATVSIKPDILYSTSDNEIVVAELVNNIPSYLI